MELEVKIDEKYPEPKVLILTASMTREVQALIQKLSEQEPQLLTGSREDRLEILEEGGLIRIYASGGKVLAVTEQGEYTLRQRLYELEAQLDSRWFVRISNSEIINLKKVKNFDLSLTGTICVKLSNGTKAYVSRRYVPKIKKILGI